MSNDKTSKRKRGFHAHFRSFSEARAFVHTLRLPNSVEYHKWARGDAGLEDIPVNPNLVYNNSGWQDWADWIGPSYRSSKKPFVPFDTARIFVHALNLPSKDAFEEWICSSERAAQIPACPHLTYKNAGWQGWKDFLGYEGRRRGLNKSEFLCFEKAREWVHAQSLTRTGMWHKLRLEGLIPENIPTTPNIFYRNSGWVNWQDWVGCPSRKSQWRSFELASDFVRSLEFSSAPSYKKWAMTPARPPDIPAAPHIVYKNMGWTNWYDWLGHPKQTTGSQFVSFNDARNFMQEQNLAGYDEWSEWCRNHCRPENIPSNPSVIYQNAGWLGWKDFLGCTGFTRKRNKKHGHWQSFDEAKCFAQSLRLWSIQDWKTWAETPSRPSDIPAHPDRVYKNEGWSGWRDFLGKGKIGESPAGTNALKPVSKWLPFLEAKKFIRRLGFSNIEEWKQWADGPEKPPDIPKTPSYAYRDQGWSGMADWLGIGLPLGRPRGSSIRVARDSIRVARDSEQLTLEEYLEY